jgi:ankyrin repeat protein
VKYCLNKNIDVNLNNNFAIRAASFNGHLEVVKYLVDNGADVNGGIESASKNGQFEILKYLVENGADVNHDGGWIIVEASMNGHLEVVKYLVENGADVTLNDNRAIKNASELGKMEVVKYLAEHGADIDKAIECAYEENKEELFSHKEKMLLKSDLKEVKQEQQKTEIKKATMRI